MRWPEAFLIVSLMLIFSGIPQGALAIWASKRPSPESAAEPTIAKSAAAQPTPGVYEPQHRRAADAFERAKQVQLNARALQRAEFERLKAGMGEG